LKIAVVDPNAWFVQGLDAVLRDDPRFSIAFADPTGDRLLREAKITGVELAVVCSRMEGKGLGGSGFVAYLEKLRRRQPELRTIARLTAATPARVRDVMQAGARGCVVEADPPETLLESIRAVASGRSSFPFIDFETLKRDPFETLTARERDVLAALAQGWTNDQISARLGISPNTVKHHLKILFSKLDVKNRAAAVARYLTERAL
jgi:two-component system nitrate/nitrite response regulator NarP